MAKGSGPIQYNELFNNDVDAKLAELSGIVNKLDLDFQKLSSTITDMSSKVAKSIRANNSALIEMSEGLKKVDVTIRGAGETMTGYAKSVEGGIKKSADLKAKQEGLNKIFNTATASVNDIKARIKTLTAEYNSLGTATDANKAKSAALAVQVIQLKTQQEQLVSALVKSKSALDGQTKTIISNSQAELDAYNKSKQGQQNIISTLNEVNKANAAAANSAIANTSANRQQSTATASNALSQKQLAQALSEERYMQQQSTAELKNNSREMLNAKGSIEQRKAALQRLTIEYSRLSAAERESAYGNRMQSIIKGLTDQVKQLEPAATSSTNSISGLFSSIKSGIFGALGPIALITAAWTALKAAFHSNVEISDNFVDVQRTAKLTVDEVDNLGDSLKKLNTRTTLDGLLDIAFIGGRLGVAKEDMVGFVETVDQLAVVLQKEFPGGADAVATALGKIISVYKITQKEGISLEQALKNTGSAFLELAHSGQVNVQYLQDFALRTAGVAQIAKLSLPTMLAYGAVLSQSGISAQVAGTAVTRLISSLSTKREDYYAIAKLADANLTLEKFTDLINTDTKQALEAFFKGLKSGNPTQTEFSDRLATLNLRTGQVKNSVIALAENQDILAKKTKIANDANAEGTSVAHNFELANNSLAAAFDKIGNSISNAFTSSSAARKLAELLNAITDNRSEADKLTQAYENNKRASENLEKELNPLIKRYDELKGKANLSKIQQTELRDITAKIGELLPGVTTKFDNYGKSVDISRGKVTELTKAQKELLELQNRDAVKKANKQFDSAQESLKSAKEKAVQLQSETGDKVYEYIFGTDAPRSIKTLRSDAKDRITSLSGEAYAAAKAIRELGGTLTKAQKDVINYYEAIDSKKKKAPQNATIVTDAIDEVTSDTVRTIADIKADIKRITDLKAPLDVASKQYKEYTVQLKALKAELKIAMGNDNSSDSKRAENERKAAAKKAIQDADDLLKAQTKLNVAALEQKEIADLAGKTETEQTAIIIQFEKDKLKIIDDGITAREKLYKKGTIAYIDLEVERANATTDAQEKIAKATEDGLNRQLALQEKYENLRNKLLDAQGAGAMAKAEFGITSKQYKGTEQDQEAQKQAALYDLRKKSLMKELSLVDLKNIGIKDATERELTSAKDKQDILNEIQRLGYEEWLRLQGLQKAKLQEMFSYLRENSSVIGQIYGQEFGNLFDSLTTNLEHLLSKTGDGIADWAETIKDGVASASSLFKQGSEERIAALETEKQQQMDIAGSNATARLAIEKAFNDRIKAEKIKQAKIDKYTAIFDIAINTAVAASKATAQAGIFGLPLAAVLIAFGAVQAGLVAAKPLPAFRTGTQNAPEGFARVGEGGPELIEGRRGLRIAYSDQVTHLNKGDKVYTAEQTRKILDTNQIDSNTELHGRLATNLHQQSSERRIKEMSIAFRQDPEAIGEAVGRRIKSLPIHQTYFDERGVSNFIQQAGTRTKYLNDRTSLK